nr:conkunitzin M16 [Conus magus]
MEGRRFAAVLILTICMLASGTGTLIPRGLPKVCTLPKKTGPCRGFYPKFYYDTKSKECKGFKYGGCKGNGNNFNTTEDCSNKCGSANRR